MRDLSLHILDLLENSIRASATQVAVTVKQDRDRNRFSIKVEDNGFGIQDPIEKVTDPFYTTKPGKKTGLGLSLFKAAAERTGGFLEIGKSELGGAYVLAVLAREPGEKLRIAPEGDLEIDLAAGRLCVTARGGASLAQIGQVLRHQHIDTTEIYARVDHKALRVLAQPWPGGVR